MPNVIEIVIQAQDKASAVMKDVGGNADGLSGKMKALGVALAGAFSFGAIGLGIKDAIDSTLQLGEATNKLARETGMTSEEASGLIYVFKQWAVDGDTAGRSLDILAKNMLNTRDAILQGKQAATPFAEVMQQLNVSFMDADGHLRDSYAVLLDLADAFSKESDSGTKAAQAMDLFGRGGAVMIPILNEGRAGIQALTAEAQKLGITLSTENAANIEKFTQDQRRMNEALLGIKVAIAEDLMPYLDKFANWFTAHQEDIKRFVDDVIRDVSQMVSDFKAGFDVIADALSWIPGHQGEIVAAVGLIGAAMVTAFGPESLAIAGLVAMVGLIGQIKNAGIHMDLGPLGTLNIGGGGGGGGPSQLAQLYAAKGALTGENWGGSPEALAAFNKANPAGMSLDMINKLIGQLEGGPEGGQPIKAANAAAKDFGKTLSDQVTPAAKKLVDGFKEATTALSDAISKVHSAITGLFANPTQEQLDLQDKIAQAKGMGPGVHFGAGFSGTSEQIAAKYQKQLDALDSEHKLMETRLQQLDKTILTEGQLKDMAGQLADKIPDLTGNIKTAADALGIHLVPGFDEVIKTSGSLSDIMGENGLTGTFRSLQRVAMDAVNALAQLANPNAPSILSPSTYPEPSNMTQTLRSSGVAVP